ncbi:trypsin-like serine peptidase [Comamonas koreensis]|uniref:Serine protease n=1 Tax=Comamonas koreensis TaxID=160825 RepID=A0AAW4Y224_9BURK|nr:serine protease [Comamonas koreensis]MCD2167930.1 serine protease [Comamonas koreensis]
MKYALFAAAALLSVAGVAASQPRGLIVDSVVLPPSLIEKSKVMPVPLDARVPTHYEVLPELHMAQVMASDGVDGPAHKIGVARAVAATSSVAQVQSALQWSPLPSGQQVAAINIQSTGAYGLRAGVLVDSLPDEALLRIYSQENPNAILEHSGADVNALLERNRQAGESGPAARTWWTPDVGAGDTTLEVMLPAGSDPGAMRISIPLVSHIYENLSIPTDIEWAARNEAAPSQAGPSESCRQDVTCTDDYQSERNAVAFMVFTDQNGSTFQCTGTLLNNAKGDFAPYFLTANHCISTQAVASTMNTGWFFRSNSCNSRSPIATWQTRHAGATLLYASDMTDSSLLRLNEMPPEGVTYAGWSADAAVPVGQDIYGLHHPGADLLKYSVGTVSDHVSCQSTGDRGISCDPEDPDGGFYAVSWGEGRTEGGSSGSALFSDGRVIGSLYGSNSRCIAPKGHSYYGRFDKFFADGASQWLAAEQ